MAKTRRIRLNETEKLKIARNEKERKRNDRIGRLEKAREAKMAGKNNPEKMMPSTSEKGLEFEKLLIN